MGKDVAPSPTSAVEIIGEKLACGRLQASNADEVLSREFLVKTIRGVEYDGFDRTIDNKIATLRNKLGDTPSQPRKIITVRSKGYVFMPDNW